MFTFHFAVMHLGKAWIRLFSFPANNMVEQTGLFSLGVEPAKKEENSEYKPVLFFLKAIFCRIWPMEEVFCKYVLNIETSLPTIALRQAPKVTYDV